MGHITTDRDARYYGSYRGYSRMTPMSWSKVKRVFTIALYVMGAERSPMGSRYADRDSYRAS
jgi:hypothetical protein